MKHKFQMTGVVLFVLATSILATIYLAWLLFPLEIDGLGLESIVSLSTDTIQHNFNILMTYLTSPFHWVLDMPDFPSSASGLHHFLQVKYLFHLAQFIWIVTLPSSFLYFKDKFTKGLALLDRPVFVWMAVVPILIATLGVLMGFDAFFTLFHQLLFPGDSSWLFDPATDPVIYILPAEFFLHCFLLFFALYEGLSITLALTASGFRKK